MFALFPICHWSSSIVGPLCDPINQNNIRVAYSVRKVVDSYVGPAMTVRNDSNDIIDVFFLANGDLNVSSLLSHSGGGDLAILRWYDQSGAGNFLEEAAIGDQPVIVLSGVLQKINSRPAIYFQVPDHKLESTNNSGFSGNDVFSMYIVKKDVSGSGAFVSWGDEDGALTGWTFQNDGGNQTSGNEDGGREFAEQSPQDSSVYTIVYSGGDTEDQVLRFNGAADTSSGTGADDVEVESGGFGVGHFRGGLDNALFFTSEIVIYDVANTLPVTEGNEDSMICYYDISTISVLEQDLLFGYSLRKVVSSYLNSAIRVRESDNNTELDIGFDGNGDLDTAALLTFANGFNCFIVKWYDQKEINDHSTVINDNQPRIVNAGVVELENGKPAAIFQGTNDALEGVTDIYTADPWGSFSIFSVQTKDSDPGSVAAVISNQSSIGGLPWFQYGSLTNEDGTFRTRVGATVDDQDTSAIIPLGTQHVLSATFNAGTTTKTIARDNLTPSSGTYTHGNNMNKAASTTHIGRITSAASTHWTGPIQEILIFDVDKATERLSIVTNQSSYYSVF